MIPIKEGDTVRFEFNGPRGHKEERTGKICKIMDYGEKYGNRVNVFDGTCVCHVKEENIIEVLNKEGCNSASN